MKTKTSLLIVGIILAALMATASSASAADIYTDRPDYEPEENVLISGTGFFNDDMFVNKVVITITRPDEEQVVSDPIDVDSGAFTYTYELDGIQGTYHVMAFDGRNTAETTFTDSDPNEIPEFSTIALPVASILGLLFFFSYRKRRKE